MSSPCSGARNRFTYASNLFSYFVNWDVPIPYIYNGTPEAFRQEGVVHVENLWK